MTRRDPSSFGGRFAVGIVTTLLVVASACGGGQQVDETAPDSPDEIDTTADAAERSVGDQVVINADLDLEGVVAAALLVASGGDLEAAIAAGLIGEAEAEAALDALERGSLDAILGD